MMIHGMLFAIPGVTGFVGPGSKPVPLSDEEVKMMGAEQTETVVDYEVGDIVRVIEGPLENFIGTVEEISVTRKSQGRWFPCLAGDAC